MNLGATMDLYRTKPVYTLGLVSHFSLRNMLTEFGAPEFMRTMGGMATARSKCELEKYEI